MLLCLANPYGGADSVCGLLHVHVAGAADERVHVGVGAVGCHMARQLCRCLLVDVAWESCYHNNMIQSFKNTGTEDVFNGENTKAARKICPSSVWKIAARKLDQVDSVTALSELRIPPKNKLEALSGDRKGQHSIRINDQYRICFVWTESGPDRVEIVDYH